MLSTEQPISTTSDYTSLQNSLNNRVVGYKVLISKIDHIISELFTVKSELIHKGLKVHDKEPTKEQTNSTIKEQKNAEDETNNQTPKPIRRRTHRSFPLNRSKFLNIEQREQVLHFVNENKELIMNQSRSDRTPFLQNLIRDQLNINLSTYMTERLISILQI